MILATTIAHPKTQSYDTNAAASRSTIVLDSVSWATTLYIIRWDKRITGVLRAAAWSQAAAVASVSEVYNNVSIVDLCVYSSLVSAALHVLTN